MAAGRVPQGDVGSDVPAPVDDLLDEGSELLIWVRAVATAILAGVIAQILVQPPGALAGVPDWLRYGAVAAGFAVFMMTRRSIFAGVVGGEIVLLAGKWWLG